MISEVAVDTAIAPTVYIICLLAGMLIATAVRKDSFASIANPKELMSLYENVKRAKNVATGGHAKLMVEVTKGLTETMEDAVRGGEKRFHEFCMSLNPLAQFVSDMKDI